MLSYLGMVLILLLGEILTFLLLFTIINHSKDNKFYMGTSSTNIHEVYNHLLLHKANSFLPRAFLQSPRFRHLRASKKREILTFSRQEGERAIWEFLKYITHMSELKLNFPAVFVKHGNEVVISPQTDFYRSIAVMEKINKNPHLDFRNPKSIAYFYKNRVLALGDSGENVVSPFVPRISPEIPHRRTHYEELNFIDD